jgi:hypothetical protein
MAIQIEPEIINMVPYFPNEIRSAESVFGDISVLFVINDQGLYYVPSFNINSIDGAGGMRPGEAYEVYINGIDPIDLVYGDNSTREVIVEDETYSETLSQIYIDAIVPTGISYPIFITQINGDVEYGDEIVAYSNNRVVGASRILDPELPVAITTWKGYEDYNIFLEGFTVGDPIDLRLYSQQEQRELKLDLNLDQDCYGEGLFSSGTVKISENSLPDSYSLNSIYPNPFNPTTKIDFSIPSDSHVNLSVYDINGRLISTIVDGPLSAGYHTKMWNASDYSSGIYIIKMSASGFNATHKVVLIK